jgi:hypothetical protein
LGRGVLPVFPLPSRSSTAGSSITCAAFAWTSSRRPPDQELGSPGLFPDIIGMEEHLAFGPHQAVAVFSALGTPSADRCAKRGPGSFLCAFGVLCDIPPCIQLRPPAPLIFWTALSERPGGIEFGSGVKPETDTLAMNLLLLLALAVPLSCLAFLTLLALLAVVTLAAVIHVLGTLSARSPQWPLGREARLGVL